uniref:Uncharacterized protein n=1 Tax=Tanacetum cinerariifolium TaxID=118510 RepID=A0A6L2MWZ9_TANCI|nr:hypothetical protein [Tanacetum cinerariifolium]
MALTFADTHNMIAYLTKSDASEGFYQIIDFFNGSLIQYALTCMSAKRSWNEFNSSMASAVISLSTGRKFNFSKYTFNTLVRNVDSSSKFYMVGNGFYGVETPLFEGMLVPQQAAADVDDVVNDDVAANVPTVDAEPTPPSPPPTTTTPPPQELPSTSQVVPTPPPSLIAQPSLPPQQQTFITYHYKIAQALEILKLKKRVRKLGKKKKLKASGLQRLKKVGTTQRIESSTDIVIDDQEDASEQGEIIDNIDVNEDVNLKDVAVVAKEVDVEKNADVQGSMHEDEPELVEIQEVIEVVTTAKLMTEVVTAATTPITIVATPIITATITVIPTAARRRKVIGLSFHYFNHMKIKGRE